MPGLHVATGLTGGGSMLQTSPGWSRGRSALLGGAGGEKGKVADVLALPEINSHQQREMIS